jgi:hypothetical protein
VDQLLVKLKAVAMISKSILSSLYDENELHKVGITITCILMTRDPYHNIVAR